jgi:hypothetical protein
MKTRTLSTVLVLGLSLAAYPQAWLSSYDAGLEAAKLGHWQGARDDFRQAAANRPEDVSRATNIQGHKWRNGAPYSPNFLAAYSLYRESLDIKDSDTQGKMMRSAADEFEKLLTEREQSRDTYFFLQVIYARLGDQVKLNDLVARYSHNASSLNWKVDEEVVAPEELSAMSVPPTTPAVTPGPTVTQAGSPQTTASDLTTGTSGTQLNPIVPGLGIANVPAVPGKYALVIGENLPQMPFAQRNAEVVRDALINYAGYAPANVTALGSPNAAQIMAAAKQIGSQVQQDGVVLIYFAGGGLSKDGKDYLVAPGGMVSRDDLYDKFLQKGARVFAFYEVNRPMFEDTFFGSEPPTYGAVSQMEATIPDSVVTSVYYQGNPVGLYAISFANVLAELRSNRIPIYEFGWQVFNKMRRGNTGTSSGASRQIPTLPVLNNLASDARF